MTNDHTFGIEIECYLPDATSATACAAAVTARLGSPCVAEGYNHTTRSHWKIVTDGSLGDYTRGIEIVSPVLQGQDGLDATRRVMEALTDFGCTVSKKCGLHVHVGAGAAPSLDFFKNLQKLYAHFEPVINGFMPASRRKSANPYCRSITHVALPAVDRAPNLTGMIRLMTAHGGEARYHKLNLDAYRKHHTVEFRQHSGTLDGTKAVNWTLFCLRMVDAAKAGVSIATQGVAQTSAARPGSKASLVGALLQRTEGVTRAEAMAATGWPSISLPQQAAACGLGFTTQRTGREVRYFAQAAAATSTVPATLDGLFDTLACPPDERDYFRARTANLSGPVQWAA